MGPAYRLVQPHLEVDLVALLRRNIVLYSVQRRPLSWTGKDRNIQKILKCSQIPQSDCRRSTTAECGSTSSRLQQPLCSWMPQSIRNIQVGGVRFDSLILNFQISFSQYKSKHCKKLLLLHPTIPYVPINMLRGLLEIIVALAITFAWVTGKQPRCDITPAF